MKEVVEEEEEKEEVVKKNRRSSLPKTVIWDDTTCWDLFSAQSGKRLQLKETDLTLNAILLIPSINLTEL